MSLSLIVHLSRHASAECKVERSAQQMSYRAGTGVSWGPVNDVNTGQNTRTRKGAAYLRGDMIPCDSPEAAARCM
jgi:hypothetical protein